MDEVLKFLNFMVTNEVKDFLTTNMASTFFCQDLGFLDEEGVSKCQDFVISFLPIALDKIFAPESDFNDPEVMCRRFFDVCN